MHSKAGVSVLMLIVGAGLLAGAAWPHSAGKNGGVFRVSLQAGAPGLDYIDPALAYQPGSGPVVDAACGRLVGSSDKPSASGALLVPDLATGFPHVSRNGKLYTYTVKKTARFNTGAPVTAAAFAHEIDRVLNGSMDSPGASFVEDIVGAADVMAGKAAKASGVRARGRTLTIRLSKPVPDLVARLSSTFFCAVPPNLPVNPEGVGAPLASAGPYYFSKYVPGRRAELRRNPRYHGRRIHHVGVFAIELGDDSPTILSKIERGEVDWGFVSNQTIGPKADEYAARYGINKSQFFVKPGGGFLRFFSLNSARPLFHDNARLRRAVNFAIDRKALQAERGGRFAGTLTDQYLEPGIPGFREARIYPGRPNVKKAKALAKGHLRGGEANVYVPKFALAQAQIVQEDLAKIGLRAAIKALPGSAYFDAIASPGEPVDIAWYGWAPDYLDPYDMLAPLLEPQPNGVNTAAYFDVPKYVRLIAKYSRRTGPARYRAFGKLDVELARKEAPLLPYSYDNQLVLISKRTGCVRFNPIFDLTAVCLK